ncbi:MAG: TonB-dependent receptor [Deltaproteobacteria bacterium]|nr:TonB-dependent receptor [Deltaproteobacteria bacterium]
MHRVFIIVILIAATSRGVSAQAPPVEATPARGPSAVACTATVDGHVVDRKTHEPVAGASVSSGANLLAQTDEGGRFTLIRVCRGPLELAIERADYVVDRRTLAIGATAISVEIELELSSEVILIEEEAPDAVEMRSATTLSGAELEKARGKGLAEALADVPGVSQLRSASGMGKPIVRGQFGRRLLLLVDGIRHRSQEWGLDHAPEIDPFVASKLTVVRGASGVRYGPDAIGGAVLVEPPELLRAPGYAAEAHLIGISNGRGGALAARVQMAPAAVPGLAWQLEGSLKRLAAASTPDYALDNTGVSEWNIGASVGYRRQGIAAKLSYLRYQAEIGVCSCLRIESREDFFAQIERERPLGSELYEADIEIERPKQAVSHDLAIARARWSFDRIGTAQATYSFQYDHRREYDVVREAITGPQFNFKLMTNELELLLEHNPIHLSDHLHLRGTTGVVGVVQAHRYSGLPLVPDYSAWGVGAYAIERLIAHDVEIEAGVRYDLLARTAEIERNDFLRLVRSGQLAMDACGAIGEQVDCASRYHTLSASAGALYRITDLWSAKLDLSTASRPPNPDEQYLNGAAPTFPVLGLGKPDLEPETTYSASVTTSVASEHVTGELSAYANKIDDYIYFAPAIDDAGAPIFDVTIRGAFPRFVTRPVDAVFYGIDAGIAVAPVTELELGAQASLVRARNTSEDSPLVFIPPDRFRGTITAKPPTFGGVRNAFVTLSGTYVRRQRSFDLAADFAAPPDPYFLLGAEAGGEMQVGDQLVKIALSGTNLLNTRYRDYTSLLRYFADQPGWQVMARLSLQFGKDL